MAISNAGCEPIKVKRSFMAVKKYTHIFLDLDNTLWDFERNSFYALQSTYHYFNIPKQVEDFQVFYAAYSKFNHLLWNAYRQNSIKKKELILLRFQQTFDELHIRRVDAEKMNEHYLSEMPKQTRLVEGAREILDYLKGRGYSLSIITNGFREVQHKKLEVTGLKRYFFKVFISEEIKTHKPGKAIFEYAVKSANARKECALMIGDDPEVDVAGALNFGIDAAWFYRQKREVKNTFVQHNNPLKRVYVVHTLAALREFL